MPYKSNLHPDDFPIDAQNRAALVEGKIRLRRGEQAFKTEPHAYYPLSDLDTNGFAFIPLADHVRRTFHHISAGIANASARNPDTEDHAAKLFAPFYKDVSAATAGMVTAMCRQHRLSGTYETAADTAPSLIGKMWHRHYLHTKEKETKDDSLTLYYAPEREAGMCFIPKEHKDKFTTICTTDLRETNLNETYYGPAGTPEHANGERTAAYLQKHPEHVELEQYSVHCPPGHIAVCNDKALRHLKTVKGGFGDNPDTIPYFSANRREVVPHLGFTARLTQTETARGYRDR